MFIGKYLLRYIKMTESKLKEIKNFVKRKIDKMKDSQHGWKHLQRVADNARNIARSLRVESKINMLLLLAACYLHDINHAFYTPGLMNYFLESRRQRRVLPGILSELKIDGEERRIIENAIYSSSYSFPFKRLNKGGDLYTQILQDSDTIDFFSKQREISFKKAAAEFGFYFFLRPFSKWALRYGRNNLKNYLNAPELVQESYVQKSIV
jgi:hypothetical protein